jgi:acyl carrier protein
VTREEVLERISQKMSELFDIDRSLIKPESRFQDLELTSLDAIDLVVELQQMTGRRMKEAGLRSIRTVDDLVTVVLAHLAEGGEPPPSPPGT